MKKKTDPSSWFRTVLIFSFIVFLALYITQETGYYNYEQHKKMVLTEEKIKEFEQDVKDGKNVDLNNYVEDIEKNYQNKITKTCTSVSKGINKYVRTGVEGIFSIIDGLLKG